MVDLVLLHGPPASGKLTIAQELSALIDARVFHNHLTLDVAKSLFNFGEPEFWSLVKELRILALQSFFKHSAQTAITTWCYEEPEDHDFFLQMKAIANAENGRILPVFLNCDISQLEARVNNAHRRDMKKLTDVKQLRKSVSEKNYRPIPDKLCIELDSATQSASKNAVTIVSEFNLRAG